MGLQSNYSPFFDVLYFDAGAGVLVYVQAMLHTLVAVNRFTAFFFPLKHSSMWTNRVVIMSTAVVAALATLFHFVPRQMAAIWMKNPRRNFGDSLYGTQVDFLSCLRHLHDMNIESRGKNEANPNPNSKMPTTQTSETSFSGLNLNPNPNYRSQECAPTLHLIQL